MKNIKQEAFVWLQLLTFLTLLILVLWFTKTPLGINWDVAQHLPEVVTAYIILLSIFKKWVWRWSLLQGWLIPFPDLQGTWEGKLQTTWKNPETGKTPPPIPFILVIRQSFDTINCVLHTEESSSYSNAAQISKEDGSEINKLSYNYTNIPGVDVRHRSIVHSGAAILTIITKPNRKLTGEYWTNRNTTGSIALKFKTKELLEEFPEELKKSKTAKHDKLSI